MTAFTHIWATLRSIYESRHEPEQMRPLAEWVWRTTLSAALFLLIGILLYGVWNFYSIVHTLNSNQPLQPAQQLSVLSRKDLSDLLEKYDARREQFDEAKQSRPNVTDPSR